MADNEIVDGIPVRGSEWEVVSLTASTYAAAPGPKEIEQEIKEKSDVSSEVEGEDESSQALFLSRHFAYPVTESLPSDAEGSQMQKMDADEEMLCELVGEGHKADSTVGDALILTELYLSDELPDLRLRDGKSEYSSTGSETTTSLLELNKGEKEETLYGVASYGSFYADAPVCEKVASPDLTVSLERGSDVAADASDVYAKNEKNTDESDIPCEAWWKRQAAFLYDQAKETNTLWSIFIAAAVMGLVFLGHHWRKEKRQILQIKWHVAVKEEKSGRVLQPISVLKNVIMGGSRANSFTQAHYEM